MQLEIFEDVVSLNSSPVKEFLHNSSNVCTGNFDQILSKLGKHHITLETVLKRLEQIYPVKSTFLILSNNGFAE